MLKIENSEGVILAFLNNLTEAKIHEVLNGEFTLNFVATVEPLKTEFLYNETNFINYEDDLFKVVTIEELHNEDDGVTVSVTAEHISYGLIDNAMDNFTYTNKTATEVMLACLSGTGFTLRTVTVTNKTDIAYTEQCNSKQISIAIASNWGGELQYHRNYVDLLARRGANRGTDFRFGKNLKTVKRIINFADNTTAYEVEVVQGSELEELGYFELGDTIRVIDDRLNADYEVRIIELEKDILTNMNSKVILGDEIKDLRSSFSSTDKKIEEVKAVTNYVSQNTTDWDKIKAITNELGNVIPEKIVGALNLAITTIKNSTGTHLETDNSSYWQNQPTKELSTFATETNAAGMMFANSKDELGEWIWTTAIDANGVTATNITANALTAMKAQIIDLVVTNLIGETIKGVTMEGGTAYFGDRVAGNYTRISSDGSITCYLKNKKAAEFWTNADNGGYISIYNTLGVEIFRIQGQGTSLLPSIWTPQGAQWTIGGEGNELYIHGNVYVDGKITSTVV